MTNEEACQNATIEAAKSTIFSKLSKSLKKVVLVVEAKPKTLLKRIISRYENM